MADSVKMINNSLPASVLYVSREAALSETNQRKWVPRIHRTAPALLSTYRAAKSTTDLAKKVSGRALLFKDAVDSRQHGTTGAPCLITRQREQRLSALRVSFPFSLYPNLS